MKCWTINPVDSVNYVIPASFGSRSAANHPDLPDRRTSPIALRMIRLPKTVVVMFLFTVVARASFGQDGWERVPRDAVAGVIIHRPDKLADRLLEIVDIGREPELRDLVTSEPHRLLTVDALDKFLIAMRDRLNSLRTCSQITFFILPSDPEWRYCAILDFHSDDDASGFSEGVEVLNAFSPWFQGLQIEQASQPDIADERKPEEAVNPAQADFFLKCLDKLFVYLSPTDVRTSGNSLIISNSHPIAEWVAVGSPSDRDSRESITRNRRFLRARSAGSAGEGSLVTAYFVPGAVLPVLDKDKYTPEHLQLMGYDELVGAWCDLRMTSRPGTDSVPRIEVTFSVPHTEPPLGITEYWKCSEPIRTTPDIRKLLSATKARPQYMVVTSAKRGEMMAALERAYESNGRSKEFEQLLQEKATRRTGNVAEWKDAFDGYQFDLLFTAPDMANHRFFLALLRHNSYDKALNYVRKVSETENRELTLRTEAIQIGDNEGWFLSNENARLQAIMNGEKADDVNAGFVYRNNGILAMPNWIVFCDRFIAETMDGDPQKEGDARPVFDQLLPGLAKFVNGFEPWWIDVQWPELFVDSVMSDCRLLFFTSRAGAGDKAMGLLRQYPVGTVFPVESRSDRLYLVLESLVHRKVVKIGSRIEAFASRDDHFQWTWRNIPISDARDRNP